MWIKSSQSFLSSQLFYYLSSEHFTLDLKQRIQSLALAHNHLQLSKLPISKHSLRTTMSQIDDMIEIGLQIFFGLIGLMLAIAAIHYRDSICSVLLRRYRDKPVQCKHAHTSNLCCVS
jgi:hypothetical protein